MNAPHLRLSDPVAPRLPSAGAIALLIPGISDVSIAAATTGAEVLFRWPGPFVVSALWFGPEDPSDLTNAGALRLRMQDANRNELLVDGGGSVDDGPSLALLGRSPRWHPFRRVVRAGDKWLFQVSNLHAANAIIPQLYFRLEEER